MSNGETQPTDLLTEEALFFLAERLTTPLQIEQYLTLAFEAAHRVGQKLVTADILQTTLAHGLDDFEPHVIRHGYNPKVLAELLNVRSAEVRSFLNGQLPRGTTQ